MSPWRRTLAFLATLAVAGGVAAGDRRYEIETIETACIDLVSVSVGTADAVARQCRVSDAGVVGTVDGETLRYAVYCLMPVDAPGGVSCLDGSHVARRYRDTALVVFADEPGGDEPARLVFERADPDVGRLHYRRPELHRVGGETVLTLPIHLAGPGNVNESEYWVRRDGAWLGLESRSWLRALAERVPEGLEIRTGLWPDLGTMQATAALYRPDDGDCCATGGTVVASLALAGDRFVLTDVALRPPRE